MNYGMLSLVVALARNLILSSCITSSLLLSDIHCNKELESLILIMQLYLNQSLFGFITD